MAVKILKGDGMYTVGGTPGLYLCIAGSGRSWILRYTAADGRRRDLGLGGYSEVTLAEARTKGAEARKDAAVGADPFERRHHGATEAAAAAMTFSKAADKYIDAKRHEWSNEKHADQWRNTLATYAAPITGHMPVADTHSRHVQQIWTIKHETATRVRGRIEQVLSWSGVMGYRPKGHNLAAWDNNLEHTLANPSTLNAAKVKHHAALPSDYMSAFWQRLCHAEGVGAKALKFLILTAARSSEARGALWSKIDLDGASGRSPPVG